MIGPAYESKPPIWDSCVRDEGTSASFLKASILPDLHHLRDSILWLRWALETWSMLLEFSKEFHE